MNQTLTRLAMALALLFPSLVMAQTGAPADCSAAAQRATGARLPDVSDSLFTWHTLRDCGAIGEDAFTQALATAVVLAEADSARVVQVFGMFHGRRTTQLFAALKAVVTNTVASGPIRSEAIRSLGAQYNPAIDFATVDFLRAMPPPEVCLMIDGLNNGIGTPTALPPDYLKQIVDAMRVAESDGSATQSVRGAALCWRKHLEMYLPALPANLRLTYICGNRFRVRNTNTRPVSVTADVYGTTYRTSFVVPNGVDYYFTMLKKGTTRLFLDGALVQTKANGGVQCPP